MGCSSCSMLLGAVGASMLSSAVTVAYMVYTMVYTMIYIIVYTIKKEGIYQYIYHDT
jgi:heme O synthase-like polyprenyltransferase